MPDFKLPTVKAPGAGTPATLKANTISKADMGGATNIKPPKINANAANVKFTKMQVPTILKDKSLDAATRQLDNMTTAAFNWNERVETARANEMVMAYGNELRTQYLGEAGPDGKIQGGYVNTKLADAQAGFAGFNQGMDDSFNRYLDNASDGIKTKAINKMARLRNQYQDKATSHNVQQFGLYENDMRYKDKQFNLQKVNDYGTAPWLDGSIGEHLDSYDNAEEQQGAMEFLAVQTLYSISNQAKIEAVADKQDITPAATAHNKTAAEYAKIRNMLPEEIQNKTDNWMEGKRKAAESAAKTARDERANTARRELQDIAPNEIALAAKSADWNTVATIAEQLKGTYKTEAQGSRAKVTALQNGMNIAMRNEAGDYPTKKASLAQHYQDLKDGGLALNELEGAQMDIYIEETLPKQMKADQHKDDIENILELKLMADGMRQQGKKMSGEVTMPPNMLPENQILWRSVITDNNAAVTMVDGKSQADRDKSVRTAAMDVQHRPLKQGELDTLNRSYIMGETDKGRYTLIMDMHKKQKSLTATTPAEHKSPDYVASAEWIKTQAHTLVLKDENFPNGVMPPKPKASDSEEERRAWAELESKYKVEVKYQMAMATADLNKAIMLPNFDAVVWQASYARRFANFGNTAKPVDKVVIDEKRKSWAEAINIGLM